LLHRYVCVACRIAHKAHSFTVNMVFQIDVDVAPNLAAKAHLGFPDDLPDLASKRPPGGNTRPNGLNQSCFEQRKRGERPDVY